MSQYPNMASIPSPTPFVFSDENQIIDINTIISLVSIINQHMHCILENTESQKALKTKCTSKLKFQSQEFFEFSEHSVLSNLYYGIENAESAYRARNANEKSISLEKSEKMLQIPASLDENGVTMGVSNGYLVCCSYFYLSVVEFIRKNEWQMAMHFLQAVLVEPRSVYADFAPGIYQRLFPLFMRHEFEKDNGSLLVSDFDEDVNVDDVMRCMARRYKPWLMYYQIMSSGDFRNRDDDDCLKDDQSQSNMKSIESQNSYEHRAGLRTYQNLEEMQHDPQENISNDSPMLEIVTFSEKSRSRETKRSSNKKCLKDILTESDSDSPIYQHWQNSSSVEDIFSQIYAEDTINSLGIRRINAEEGKGEALNHYGSLSWNSQARFTKSKPDRTSSTLQLQTVADETKAMQCFSSFSNKSASSIRKTDQCKTTFDDYVDDYIYNSFSRMQKSLSCRPETHDENVLEKLISNLCFAQELENGNEDYTLEMKTIYEILNSKPGLKYSLLKDVILDQLLIALSTSKQDRVVRSSVSILSTIVTENRSVIDEIKKRGLQLYDLATALKRNVHEAVILIYLINPSPAEIKALELLPCLVEVVCASKSYYKVEVLLTPPSASLMMIELLVTAFDVETNSMHLATISSPRVISGLVKVPRRDNLDELVSLASVLVKCMRFDGKCRKYISEFSSVGSFVKLLWSNEKRVNRIGLEFFNELLKMPRSSAIGLLKQMKKQGNINNMCALYLLMQSSEDEYKLLAANLLLHLEVLEDTSSKHLYGEEATEALVESLTREDCLVTRALSSFILSNLGGTYSWTGEPYTMSWLLKKTGLTLPHHKNLIKNYDFLDHSLTDGVIDSWCSKIAQRILRNGISIFHALNNGLKNKSKRVSIDCLIATAWLGFELVNGPDELRHDASEILLETIEEYLHPGFELEERLLACLCIYNYTSGKGMKKLINLSEGVRESLRRLSNVTWMAEELLKVADYYQPNKWRISCVHSQILEAGDKNNGAVTALIYYKGQLYSGYADGSIKVWDVKGQIATLVNEMKEHKKAVTCFALYEPGNCLLSGSSDKTIKIWQMIQKKLECIEVIPTRESIRSVDSWGELIFVTTQNHKLKIIDASRKAKDVFKNNRVKCIKVAHGKVYGGCIDSSIQELMVVNNRQQEIKAPLKRWMQNKPISSVSLYKDWLYCASLVVEGSKIKDWRKNKKPEISIVPEKGASILSMEIVEDFIYLNCSTSTSSLQIWLRGTQQKVGRLSAGSKITSILSANDMILCGTEKGLIKDGFLFEKDNQEPEFY
ncbi:hypothetical protein CASFOL_030081 [Castilleja foliolosa]|uniref:E3 ubiquitin-protein ligase LIN-1 n=1 Tax=Castilleja foliolosa TaxID=1961234 RepID=A0ABD3CAD7_9LAMI